MVFRRKIQNLILDFYVNPLEQINEFHHFKEYNESYDLINCIALHIPYEFSFVLVYLHICYSCFPIPT